MVKMACLFLRGMRPLLPTRCKRCLVTHRFAARWAALDGGVRKKSLVFSGSSMTLWHCMRGDFAQRSNWDAWSCRAKYCREVDAFALSLASRRLHAGGVYRVGASVLSFPLTRS